MRKILTLLAVLLLAQGLAHGWAQAPEKGTPVALDAAEKRKLGVFFSNFSETMMPGFLREGPGDAQMLEFATTHLAMNAEKSLKKSKDGYTLFIGAERVDAVTRKFLDRTVSRHAEKVYKVPAASGEIYVFSQVDRLAALGPDTFLAEGTIYYAGAGEAVDPHATPRQWKKAGKVVQPSGSFTALVRKVDGPDARYVLLEYDMVRTDL